MTLVDTSVWVAHLSQSNEGLKKLLTEGKVSTHPFIIGELACGNLKNRSEILALLQDLPTVTQAEHSEALQFIENYGLMGKGLGYIDIHLLASALLSKVAFWTFDKKLNAISQKLGISY